MEIFGGCSLSGKLLKQHKIGIRKDYRTCVKEKY